MVEDSLKKAIAKSTLLWKITTAVFGVIILAMIISPLKVGFDGWVIITVFSCIATFFISMKINKQKIPKTLIGIIKFIVNNEEKYFGIQLDDTQIYSEKISPEETLIEFHDQPNAGTYHYNIQTGVYNKSPKKLVERKKEIELSKLSTGLVRDQRQKARFEKTLEREGVIDPQED